MKSAALETIYLAKLEEESARGAITWPSARYAKDPIGFAMTILGFAPTAWQAEILESFATDDNVIVKGARKLGKSKCQAAGALWNFCLYPDSTSVCVAPTEGQIERVVYHDLLGLHGQSGRCLSCKIRNPSGPRPCPHSACIDGEPSPSCRAGVQVGARRIFGIAPRNSDHMRGISGPHQFYVLDESPGIDQDVRDACVGNVAATGRTVAAFGNPSSRFGWFFDAATKAGNYRRISGSALESPNVVLGCRVVEGLADTKWIEAMRAECDEDDPKWQVDVLGEFPTRDMLRVLDDVSIARCFKRWEETPPSAAGELFVGVDAAGGTGGDTSVIATRRGWRFEPLHGFQGGTDRIMFELLEILRLHRRGRERVVVNYDAAGRFGKDLGIALGALRRSDENIEARGLDGRGFIPRTSPLYRSGFSRPRDAFWGNAAQLLKNVVAIPYHEEFREDFTFAEWEKDGHGRDRLKEKTEQRKATQRSPDYGDAVCYCLWDGTVAALSEFTEQLARDDAEEIEAPAPRRRDIFGSHDEGQGQGGPMDPYSGGMDPYGGGFR